jgi:branched-chain amino acid transport system ATP-binding protein
MEMQATPIIDHLQTERRTEMALLEVNNLSVHFGGIKAVTDVSFKVEEGQIYSIIGPNGAGKTTTFNLLTGFIRPSNGNMLFDGRSILRLSPPNIAQLGITRTYQKTSVFPGLTVLENARIGNHRRQQGGTLDALLHTQKWKDDEHNSIKKAYEVLESLGLAGDAGTIAKNLPYGKLRLVEIAVALCLEPRLILLDEPASGMNPEESDHMMQIISRLRGTGITILLVEHNMQVVMGISDYILVLDHGVEICEGTPDTVCSDPLVIEAYLGRGYTNAQN